MEKVENYYEDSDDGLSQDIIDSLDESYWETLDHIDCENQKKVLICFSGASGVGKSSLAEVLSAELSAIRIENDGIKEVLLELYNLESVDEEYRRYVWQYSMHLYRSIDKRTPNGVIVRDGMIDYYHDQIFPIFEEKGYQIIIIGFDLSHDFIESKIKERGDKEWVSAEKLVEILPMQIEMIAKFREMHEPNYLVTEENWGQWKQIAQDMSVDLSQ